VIPATSVLANRSARAGRSRDESYIIDLCDELLGIRADRQRTFPFLKGDSNARGVRRCLPVDAYYPEIDLVVEYHEQQHTERHAWFDRRTVNKKTGETRGAQRKRYDRLRQTILPRHGIALIVLDYTEFDCSAARRLRRTVDTDRVVLRRRLAHLLPAARGKTVAHMEALERLTLHREMQAILHAADGDLMLPPEIASAVNRRGRYRRRDGTPVPGSQVIARALKYQEIFECRRGSRGLQIALRERLRRR